MKITATPKCSFFLLLLAGGTAPQRDAVFGFTTTTSNSRRTPRNTHFQSGATTVLYSASPVVPEETTRKVSKSVTTENASITASAATATSDATTIPTAKSSPQSVSPLGTLSAAIFGTTNKKQGNNSGTREYQRGLITIGFITLLFSSNSPVLHAAFHQTDGGATPPVLLLNAAVSAVALVGLLLGGETLEQNTDLPSTLQQQQQQQSLGGGVQEPQESFLESQESSVGSTTTTNNNPLQLSLTPEDKLVLRGGCELGLWKFLGTTANIYGLSLTTAAHGAFLIQLTTLIVPVIQSIQGVPIPKRIQWSIVLALAGVVCFTQDPTGTPSLVGDGLCVLAAIFYATYDLRLFSWGKQVVPRRLITGKIATQAMLSLGLLLTAGSTSGLFGGAASSSLDTVSDLSAWQETIHYLSDNPQWTVLIPVVLWSGVVVNALAPFLQVAGQQAVGPTRCQTIYASQPLWAGIMGFVVFGDTIGWQGVVGGSAFLTALFLAATTEAPDAECGKKQCEV